MSQIFMGNCNPGCTEARILELHRKIDEAVILISGIQQNGGMGHEFDEKENRKAKEALYKLTAEIVEALTGNVVVFQDKKPTK